jgi:Flp pilus assembly protein TadD
VFVAPRARLLLAEGRVDDALELLDAAPETARTFPLYRLALAQAHARAGRTTTAELEYRALLDLPGASPWVRRQAAEGLEALQSQ